MLLRRMFLGLGLAAAVVGQASAAEALKLNTEKSKIEFVGKKPDGKHVGGFKKFKANATADLDNPTAGSLEIMIDTPSLWSDDEKLTNHLKNPNFFDVRKYPQVTFKSTKITANEESAKITGDMTMLGKKVEVTVPAKAEVTEESITVIAEFKIDRTKWGMEYGVGKIDNEVDVTATLVFDR
jgi:polyisoprenoid-binding protein YceI